MTDKAIRDRLVEHGQKSLRSPRQIIQFTKMAASDALLNDLANHPHAFVLASVMDRQIKAEKAWLIPFADYFSIDTSADVHIRRVFARLGSCAPGCPACGAPYYH